MKKSPINVVSAFNMAKTIEIYIFVTAFIKLVLYKSKWTQDIIHSTSTLASNCDIALELYRTKT